MNANKRFRFLLTISLLLPMTSRIHAQTTEAKCDWTAFERSAAEMRAARDAAMKISEDDLDTEVPPEAIKQIQQFKNSLYGALQSYFVCQPNRIPDNKTLESDLYTRLAIPIPPPRDNQPVGDKKNPKPSTGLYLKIVAIDVVDSS